MLAIQFGYLPGLVWLVVGVCLAGAVQDMMVLAASTRRDGLSLAGLARTEIGRPAGLAAAIAILYIVIIALAGLGIVVVKALGGEQVTMKAGTVLVYPERSPTLEHKYCQRPAERLQDSRRARLIDSATEPEETMVFHEAFDLAIPANAPHKADPTDKGMVLPGDAVRLVPGSSWGTFTIACTIPIALFVGWYMYRLRRGKILEASLIGAALVLAATVAGVLIPGSKLEPYFSLSRDWTVFALAGYGFVAAVLPVWLLLCPRDYLSTFLKIGTILLLVGGVLIVNPKLQAPAFSPYFSSGGGPYFDGPDFSLCLHLHHVRGDFRVSRAGRFGNDAQDGRSRKPRADDRLRRDADGGPGGGGGLDRGGGLAQLDVLRHQHPAFAAARVPGAAP